MQEEGKDVLSRTNKIKVVEAKRAGCVGEEAAADGAANVNHIYKMYRYISLDPSARGARGKASKPACRGSGEGRRRATERRDLAQFGRGIEEAGEEDGGNLTIQKSGACLCVSCGVGQQLDGTQREMTAPRATTFFFKIRKEMTPRVA